MINIQNLVFYILMFLIIGILVIVLMPSKNKSLILENYFKKSKLFIVPIIILVLSILCFCIYTVSVQNVVFIFILLFNWGIFNFYETERKLAFLFFLLNLFFIVMYIRWSINAHIQLALLYYAMLFIGFHIFEETFTKRFYLRTKIIITGYYKKSVLFKLVLWFFLIFIPSLIKHPIVIVTEQIICIEVNIALKVKPNLAPNKQIRVINITTMAEKISRYSFKIGLSADDRRPTLRIVQFLMAS